MRIQPTLLLLLLALTASADGFAARKSSDGAKETTTPALSPMQENGVSLSQAVEQVRRQCDGRIVSAVTKRNGNRETHEIKCLTQDGKVRTFRIAGKRQG